MAHLSRALDCQPGWWVRTRHHEGRIAWLERPAAPGYAQLVIHFECGAREVIASATRVLVL